MRRKNITLPVLLALALASGCVSVPKRNPLPEHLVGEAQIPGIPLAKMWGDEPPPFIRQWYAASAEELKEMSPGIFGVPHHYLALSGGGANGAFGAGVLVGWTEAGDRPEFTMVTGISTGALIAPFAFLGSDYDATLKELYTTTSTDEVVKLRGKLKTITSDAASSTEPLQALLDIFIDDAMIEAMAVEHRKGRRLFIGTTNLDTLRPVVWSLGAIADSGRPEAAELIRQVLLASASIPAAMPPVLVEVEADGELYDELHVDGGAASQVFFYPVGLDWDRVLEKLQIPGSPDAYIIRNSRLAPEWKAVENKFSPILMRSVDSLIRTQGIGDLYRIYLASLRDGLDFHLAYIPDEFEEQPTELFDEMYMRKLFELGYGMARSGYPWTTMPPEMIEAKE